MVYKEKMKTSKIVIITTVLAVVQAYTSYLLHNDVIQFAPLQWIISLFYIPLYIILLFIGGVLESLFSVSLFRSGVIFPYLRDVLWLVGAVVLLPVNYLLVRWVFNRKHR